MTDLARTLEHGIAELNLNLPESAADRLGHYLALLQKWNQVYNLTAVRDPERMVVTHLLDSLAAVPYLSAPRVLDVGSGGGMPGIPLAIACPDTTVVMLDANHKKTTFLRQAVIELGLGNADVVCDRVENYHPEHSFDVITARAFSDLAELVRLTSHLLAEGGRWSALKGVYPYEEIALLPETVRVEQVSTLKVPGLDAERHLITLVRN